MTRTPGGDASLDPVVADCHVLRSRYAGCRPHHSGERPDVQSGDRPPPGRRCRAGLAFGPGAQLAPSFRSLGYPVPCLHVDAIGALRRHGCHADSRVPLRRAASPGQPFWLLLSLAARILLSFSSGLVVADFTGSVRTRTSTCQIDPRVPLRERRRPSCCRPATIGPCRSWPSSARWLA